MRRFLAAMRGSFRPLQPGVVVGLAFGSGVIRMFFSGVRGFGLSLVRVRGLLFWRRRDWWSSR
jgi:hypothetical protein